jgi:hypothetical protein
MAIAMAGKPDVRFMSLLTVSEFKSFASDLAREGLDGTSTYSS